MTKYLFYTLIFCLVHLATIAQPLSANAGPTQTVCTNKTFTIGGSPTAFGGNSPYTYAWSPSTFLNNSNIANPVGNGITSDMWYQVIVTDKDGKKDTSYVFLKLDIIQSFNAGIDTGYCFGQELGPQIGAPNNSNTNHSFNWLPTLGLDNPTSTNPIATPTVNTTYTLIVSDAFCPDHLTQVNVSAFMPPSVNASADTTIDEGSTITLNGSGAVTFWWTPDYNIKYVTTANPDVWPTTTTTYYLYTTDQHGCYNSDGVVVRVRNGDQLFFYNTFTPNNDGDNDSFYIGNVEKYPDNSLKIYNRYGKVVYSSANYTNDWNGSYLGNELPTGTYFYIFDDGKGQKHKGSVTIMR